MSKHPRTIKRHLKELRMLIDTSADPVERRIAYAMECAVRWTVEDTVGWNRLAAEAVREASILRSEISSGGHQEI